MYNGAPRSSPTTILNEQRDRAKIPKPSDSLPRFRQERDRSSWFISAHSPCWFFRRDLTHDRGVSFVSCCPSFKRKLNKSHNSEKHASGCTSHVDSQLSSVFQPLFIGQYDGLSPAFGMANKHDSSSMLAEGQQIHDFGKANSRYKATFDCMLNVCCHGLYFIQETVSGLLYKVLDPPVLNRGGCASQVNITALPGLTRNYWLI